MSNVIIINCHFTALMNNFYQRAEMCLSAPERRLFLSYEKTRRQQQFLAGHYCLRIGLTQLLGQSEEYWDIDQKIGSAPRLLNPPLHHQVYLSISHSKDQVVCTVSLNNPVGIDLESNYRDRPFVEFSEQYLSAIELSKLKSFHGAERKSYFYSLWTVMESVAKLRGKGLGQDIFDGEWELDDLKQDSRPTIAENGYSTCTYDLNDFTMTLATESALEGPAAVFQYSNAGLEEKQLRVSKGVFLLRAA